MALALLLAACGGSAAPASSTPASAAASAGSSAAAKPSGGTKLVVGLSQVIPQFLPAWVAKDQGVYAKHGLDVDQRQSTATTIMAALLANEVNIAVTGGPETLNATANGADLVIAGNLAPVAALKFHVSKAIKSKEDLPGKKFGITRLGSTTHSNIRALLSQQGLNPDNATYIQLDNSPAELAALISGQIDAVLLAPPESEQAEAQGFRVMYDLGQLKFPATGQVIVMQRAWLSGHRDTVQAFVDSVMDALGLAKREKTVGLASIRSGLKLDDPQLQSGVYDYFVGSILAPVPLAQPDQFANDIGVVQQATGKLKDFDVSKMIDNSFVQNAADRGLGKS